MLKVTITFPSGVTITLETTEADKYGEVIASTREYLSSDGIAPSTNGNGAKPTLQEEPSSNGNGHLASSPEFLEFCQLMAPSGDMRRVVVAAEGAKRFLGMDKGLRPGAWTPLRFPAVAAPERLRADPPQRRAVRLSVAGEVTRQLRLLLRHRPGTA